MREIVDQCSCVVRVAEHRFAAFLYALRQTDRARISPGFDAVAVDLHHFRFDMGLDQITRTALGDFLAVVNHCEARAKPLGFFHEVRGEDQGLALRHQLAQAFPDHVARLRIEAGGRLVEDDEIRIVDQGARQREAAFHAAGQGLNPRVALRRKVGEIEQRRNARARGGVRQAEVTSVHQQIFGHREIGVEIVHLRHYADALARFARVLRYRMTENVDVAAIRCDQTEAQFECRRLAGAVRAEQTKAGAARNREVQTGDHFLAAIGLVQILDRENDFTHRLLRFRKSKSRT